ncbi:MAG: diguanylate cyclase (GGDEF)-like protein [Porticoccus sp.]|jgi:diguanylate cyclase (GGDEF)-like protein|uniref:GGDEF domain-containing protein n=1 Tax=Porticoccus sp. TaxID=2024853 RepID=UPI0039E48495|tara:strand:- start:61238 stop:62431 length:1194 start_codon:yes stop_codon:yes gene_type:complete
MAGKSGYREKLDWCDKTNRAPQRAAAVAEAQWQSVIIGILMLTGGLVMTALSLWDIYVDLGPVWTNLVTLAAGLIITFFYILLLNKGGTSVRLTVVILRLTLIIMVFLHFFWLLVEDVEWSGLLWCLVMLPLFFHLLGYQRGSILVLLLISGTTWLLFRPSTFYSSPHSTAILFRFWAAYLILAWISFSVEYIRHQTRQRLQATWRELDIQACTDELTGLANRRGLREYLGKQEQRSSQGEGSYAVILGDMDDFKQINDRYGHDVGDRVLSTVGKLISSLARADDLAARWGGEEFLLLLADTDAGGAEVLAEKVRDCVATSKILVDGKSIELTMSLGVAAQQQDVPLSALLKSADTAMYEAKRRGKNSVVMANRLSSNMESETRQDSPVVATDPVNT